MNRLAKNVSGMRINSGKGGEWQDVSKKNKNRVGSSGVRQRGYQDSAPKAWGQADTAQRLGIRGKEIVVEEEEDDDEEDDAFDDDDDDDDLLSDDESPPSHETIKILNMLKSFFETLDKFNLEQINDTTRQWHCPACQGGPGAIDWCKGLQPLANHARTKNSKRVKLHRLFANLLEEELHMRGTSTIPGGEIFGNWEGLRTETKDHEIVWPPMVIVFNMRLNKGDDDKWIGMGNQELIANFIAYKPEKARHSFGPQGHRGFSFLLFHRTDVGYMNAERLHNHFLEEGKGREAWNKRRNMFSSGGRRRLYGCLATKDDIEFFNQHCQEKQRLKYELKSHNEMVVSQTTKINEEHQQLLHVKHKYAEEKRENALMKESMRFLSEMVRKKSEENRIVKQMSTMHHMKNQEELDYQENFFEEQMNLIKEGMNKKEDSFEKFHQDERKKAEDLNFQASSAENCRHRIQELEKSKDTEISQFETERDELHRVYYKKQDELKKMYQEGLLALEKELDASLTQLMEKFAPGSTSGDASSLP